MNILQQRHILLVTVRVRYITHTHTHTHTHTWGYGSLNRSGGVMICVSSTAQSTHVRCTGHTKIEFYVIHVHALSNNYIIQHQQNAHFNYI
jgi:hypothetical protein